MQRSSFCCPHCGAIESVSARQCHRCGAILQPPAAPQPQWLREIMAREDMVTRFLQGCLYLAFGLTLIETMRLGGSLFEAFDPQAAYQNALVALGSLRSENVAAGEWWRLLTASFLHFGILHLIFNSMAISAVGPETERQLGHLRFTVVYLLSVLGGNLASLGWHAFLWQAPYEQVGASGGVCGLIGALYMVARFQGGAYGRHVQQVVVRWIGLNLFIGLILPGVDNAAHLGGMLCGAGLVYLFGRPRRGWVA